MTLNIPGFEQYLCTRDDVFRQIEQIDPREYEKSRNHLNGAVSWLSPFMTHGIINTSTMAKQILRSHSANSCYRLLFELAWREYFHRVWQLQGDAIFSDLQRAQAGKVMTHLPKAILQSQTGIEAIDECLEHLQTQGLIHNHARLWVAGMICNMADTHWYEAARWFHYHLLDGDLASNTLSWQWVAGTFSQKAYVANQANINKYSSSTQSDTWLDVPYEAFDDFTQPSCLQERAEWQSWERLSQNLPVCTDELLPGTPVQPMSGSIALYSLWHMDPDWQPDVDSRILFVDVDYHRAWPMSAKRWRLILHWANELDLQIQFGSIDTLHRAAGNARIVRREYPACVQWPGTVEPRSWLYPLPDKHFNSFSQYWKQVRGSVGL